MNNALKNLAALIEQAAKYSHDLFDTFEGKENLTGPEEKCCNACKIIFYSISKELETSAGRILIDLKKNKTLDIDEFTLPLSIANELAASVHFTLELFSAANKQFWRECLAAGKLKEDIEDIYINKVSAALDENKPKAKGGVK